MQTGCLKIKKTMKYGMIAKVIILMNEDLMKVSINYMTLKVVLYD